MLSITPYKLLIHTSCKRIMHYSKRGSIECICGYILTEADIELLSFRNPFIWNKMINEVGHRLVKLNDLIWK